MSYEVYPKTSRTRPDSSGLVLSTIPVLLFQNGTIGDKDALPS